MDEFDNGVSEGQRLHLHPHEDDDDDDGVVIHALFFPLTVSFLAFLAIKCIAIYIPPQL